MEEISKDRRALEDMKVRLSLAGVGFDEMLATGIFCRNADYLDTILDDTDSLNYPGEIKAWLNIKIEARRFNVTPAEIWSGLQQCAARGILRVAVDIMDPNCVVAELLHDPRVAVDPGAFAMPWFAKEVAIAGGWNSPLTGDVARARRLDLLRKERFLQ